jgi:PAS domain S-box-containing protein
MVEGVVMVDEAGKILMMNPAAEQLYGASLAEVAGQPLTSKASEEHVITLAKELTAPPGDHAVDASVDVAGGGDTRRTIKSSGAIVQNQDGKVVGMVSQLTDVAKHKELQRMQRDFIAHVTHELRAPLSSIRAALEILQGEVSDKIREEENRMLQTALKNADRLADLINSILDFSKIESGQMAVFPKKYDAERIARDGVDSLGAWASKKRLNLSLVTSPGLPPVSADAPRVVQVLVNLLSNAIKFTPVGGSITVRCGMAAEKTGGERFVQYSVTDTGPGIPKAEQKRVFEKFVQIAAGEMHVGGTGLGLAIAKALVHLHGGKMWLESEPNQGATFLFTLPVYSEPKETTQVKAAAPLPWWKRLLGAKK